MKARAFAGLAALALLTAGAAAEAQTFTNPILPSGADPWVARVGRTYYYMQTEGDRLELRRTENLGRLRAAPRRVIWRPHAKGPASTSIWAPELHRLNGRWYVYFTASVKGRDVDASRRIYVLEADGDDPMTARWSEKEPLKTRYAGLDGTVFEHEGRLFFAYSAYVDDHSDIMLAPMANPWTLGAPEVDIAAPDKPWEMQGGRKIMEGPEFLPGPKGQVFLTYSGSACWSDDYALGLLAAFDDADLLDPKAWRKSPQPVFAKAPERNVYATGHNGFFTAPDGTNWLVYHANTGAGRRCGHRSPRIQPFTFDAAGRPEFGRPVAGGAAVDSPGTTPHQGRDKP